MVVRLLNDLFLETLDHLIVSFKPFVVALMGPQGVEMTRTKSKDQLCANGS